MSLANSVEKLYLDGYTSYSKGKVENVQRKGSFTSNLPKIKFVKLHENAVTPEKAHVSDIGFDLTIIGEHKIIHSEEVHWGTGGRHVPQTVLYNTGIAVSPPPGYYTEIIPRSSLSKTGWILANSIGIIDPSYTGELFIALTKVWKNAQPIIFGNKYAQLVLRKAEYGEMSEVESLDDTDRGEGGFGSSGK